MPNVLSRAMPKNDVPQNDVPHGLIAIHIRSTDKYLEARIIDPKDYVSFLRSYCLFSPAICYSVNSVWIATDNWMNVDTFQRGLELQNMSTKFKTFALPSKRIQESQKRRYSSESFEDTLTDLRILVLSEVAIGTFSSNFLMMAYKMGSVLNHFVSDSTFLLDTQYKLYPIARLPINRLAGCDYVFPEQSESTLAPGQQWNREFKKITLLNVRTRRL